MTPRDFCFFAKMCHFMAFLQDTCLSNLFHRRSSLYNNNNMHEAYMVILTWLIDVVSLLLLGTSLQKTRDVPGWMTMKNGFFLLSLIGKNHISLFQQLFVRFPSRCRELCPYFFSEKVKKQTCSQADFSVSGE